MARLIILVLIITLVSCGGGQNDSKTNRDNSSANVDNNADNKPKDKKGDKKGDRKKGQGKKGEGKKGRKGKGEGRNQWNNEDEEDVVINVEAESIIRGDAVSVFKTTTILEADLESAVTSKASGIVLQLNVEVGDVVKEGQVLAVLESDLQKLRLESATANYRKSSQNYERAKSLLQKGLVNKESVENLKYETQSLKTNLDQAKLDLDFTRIKAPISGVITKRNIKKGNLIQQNTEVYNIVNFESIQAIINVPENKWGLFETGLEVMFEFGSHSELIKGQILRIDPVVDSATGTFKVVISIDETTSKLRPGLFGKTQIILDKRENILLVTKNAVIREDENAYVYLINEDKTVTKSVLELGYEMQDSIEVISGLEEGQQVVTTGKNNVSPESTVEVIEYND